MAHPKFIITLDGHFRLGMVNMHAELLKPSEVCIGGGFYDIDHIAGIIRLDGNSFDFGKPQWHALEKLLVPAAYRGLRIVYTHEDGTTFNVSNELQIQYV